MPENARVCQRMPEYPENTNIDFIIELPERLNFRQNWTVTLKTLFLSNKIQNIEDCHVQYRMFNPTGYVVHQKNFSLKNGNYGTLASFIHEIAEGFKRKSMPFSISEVENGRVKIKLKGKDKSESKGKGQGQGASTTSQTPTDGA